MASKYWIKLYHEILDDPKMMRMSEVLFARCIKLFLLAGDYSEEGELPSIDDCAWRLRIPAEEMESDFIELQKLNVLAQTEGVWRVTKWEEHQGAMSEKKRSSLRRKEHHRQEYQEFGPANMGVTTVSRPDSDRERDRFPVVEIEEKRIDIDKEESAVEFIGAFLEFSGFSKPGSRRDQEKWESAAIEAVDTFGDSAESLARKAFVKLRDSNYTIAGPQSLLNTMRSLDAKELSDPYEVKQA